MHPESFLRCHLPKFGSVLVLTAIRVGSGAGRWTLGAGYSCILGCSSRSSGRSVGSVSRWDVVDFNQGRQMAPVDDHRGDASILLVSSLTQDHLKSSSSGLKCITGMKTTQCTVRSRVGPNPH